MLLIHGGFCNTQNCAAIHLNWCRFRTSWIYTPNGGKSRRQNFGRLKHLHLEYTPPRLDDFHKFTYVEGLVKLKTYSFLSMRVWKTRTFPSLKTTRNWRCTLPRCQLFHPYRQKSTRFQNRLTFWKPWLPQKINHIMKRRLKQEISLNAATY